MCPVLGQTLGVTEVSPEVVALVSHATQEYLHGMLEKLTVMAEHRKAALKVQQSEPDPQQWERFLFIRTKKSVRTVTRAIRQFCYHNDRIQSAQFLVIKTLFSFLQDPFHITTDIFTL